jgi:hypothetical protein
LLPDHLNYARRAASERHDIGSPSILNMPGKTYLAAARPSALNAVILRWQLTVKTTRYQKLSRWHPGQ